MKSFVDAFDSEEGKAELKKLFMSIDTDGSGSVTSKEWGKAIGQHWKEMGKFFGGLSMGEVGKMFKKLDADGSGDLTWDEFENALQQLDMKAGHDKEPNHGGQQMLRPQRVSSQWRTNPTLESFAQPLRLTERSKEQLENLWRVLNKKKDDRIDYDDFVGLAKGNHEVARRRWQEMSTHFDSDRNGHITPIEFIEGFKALVLRRPLDLEGSFRSMPRTHVPSTTRSTVSCKILCCKCTLIWRPTSPCPTPAHRAPSGEPMPTSRSSAKAPDNGCLWAQRTSCSSSRSLARWMRTKTATST